MRSINWLDEKLEEYFRSDMYPFHMPGHKRQSATGSALAGAEQIDITEIEGFDNLHQSEDILLQAQERMAALFGACKSFFLVNGSTSGILTAVHAATHAGDRFLIARNCHRSVWHAAMLNRLRCDTISPMETEAGIQGSIDPMQLHQMLKKAALKGDPYSAVLITSPTYDGVLSDIEAIASCVHAFRIPLIVDEAHGAHLGFYPGTKKATACGADYVIESLHKTLPALTQTAVLHLADSPCVCPERTQRYLPVFQTSSPSYVLMASMDHCTRILSGSGTRLFRDFDLRIRDFYRFANSLKQVDVLPAGSAPGIFDRDPSRLLIRIRPAVPAARAADSSAALQSMDATAHSEPETTAGMSGSEKAAKISGRRILASDLQNGAFLLDWLREQHHLVMEMAAGPYVTALTSVMDTDEGFSRLKAALLDLDRLASEQTGRFPVPAAEGSSGSGKTMCSDVRPALPSDPPEKCMELYEAVEQESRLIPLSESAGAVSAEFVGLYPPGIPLLIPGERIPSEILRLICRAKAAGISVTGLESDRKNGLLIRTIK